VSHGPTKALGVVSLLNDISSEVTLRTQPLFLANILGVKTGIIELIEGLAESTATLLKIVSGMFADRSGKKKGLTLWGYGLSGFTKPLLFFATGRPLVLAVRVLDRIGKGIRTAPPACAWPGGGSTPEPAELFLALAAFSLVVTLSSTPGGALSDWLGRRDLIVMGWVIYAVIYLGFVFASAPWHVWVLYLSYGLYYEAFGGGGGGQRSRGRPGLCRTARDRLRPLQRGRRRGRVPSEPACRSSVGQVRRARSVPAGRCTCPGGGRWDACRHSTSLSLMVSVPEGSRGASRPHSGAHLSAGFLDGGGSPRPSARLFDDLRIGPGKSERGTPLAVSFRRGFL